MKRRLVFTREAELQLAALRTDPVGLGVLKQVRKTLGLLEIDLRHPSLKTHEYHSIRGLRGEKIFEAYAQNKTPGAWRIFFHYGPDEHHGDKRIAVITIVAITPHP